MSNNSTKDLTSGSPMKLILGFSIPLLFGFLFQQFYSLVDTIIVGQFLGIDALAAVGSTGSINFMIIGFCMGVCNGFAIPIAHRFGARDIPGVHKVMANCLWLCLIFSLVMTLVVCVLCRNIMIWMNTPANILEDANRYIFLIFLGIPATYLYNMLSGIIRSLGDSKTPVFFLVLSSLINIALDLFFIVVLHLGVSGAAAATVIAQAVSGITCLLYMKKHYPILHMSQDEWRWDGNMAKLLCNVGIPMGLQYSITAIGSVILQTAVNGLGSMAVAAITAGGRVGMFFCCPYDALGSTMATYGGQNVGAKKLDRLHSGLKSSILLGIFYSIIAFVILFLWGKPLGSLFMDSANDVVLSQVHEFLVINAAFYIPLALVNVIRFLIQGMGFSKFAIFAGVFEMFARSLVGFLLVPAFGYTAACYAGPVAWVFADLFLIPAYLHVHKRLSITLHGSN